MILWKKLLEKMLKIGEVTLEREKTMLLRGILHCWMMSPLLNSWKEKESRLGDRLTKRVNQEKRIPTLLIMAKKVLNMMVVIVLGGISGPQKVYLETLV